MSNVVFMGMGEPLANYKAVIGAVRQLITPTPDGFGLSARGVTVSTVGLVPRMQQLATEGIPVTLALSLHAPDDELRDELVPVNTRWNVDEVVDAAWEYARSTTRAGLDRVRPDPRHQRPGRSGPTCWPRCCAAGATGAGCTSTSSRSTRRPARGGRRPAAATRTSSSAGCGPRACR